MKTKQDLLDYINSLPDDSDFGCALRVLQNNELSITKIIPCPEFSLTVDEKAKNETVAEWDDFIGNLLTQKAQLGA